MYSLIYDIHISMVGPIKGNILRIYTHDASVGHTCFVAHVLLGNDDQGLGV